MNKEEWEDYKNLSSQITEKLDNTSTYESWLIIQEYIDRCQQENQKYKEIIDKAIEYIEKLNRIIPRFWFTKLLEILKEVE
ncbi:MAG: hypothetical protein MR691_15025 [Clostridium sp.]|nr:hypothetical protein [Clostridium sp.]